MSYHPNNPGPCRATPVTFWYPDAEPNSGIPHLQGKFQPGRRANTLLLQLIALAMLLLYFVLAVKQPETESTTGLEVSMIGFIGIILLLELAKKAGPIGRFTMADNPLKQGRAMRRAYEQPS